MKKEDQYFKELYEKQKGTHHNVSVMTNNTNNTNNTQATASTRVTVNTNVANNNLKSRKNTPRNFLL